MIVTKIYMNLGKYVKRHTRLTRQRENMGGRIQRPGFNAKGTSILGI